MEGFFNELSISPKSNEVEVSRQRVYALLETMKALKVHNFNVLRSHANFYAEDLGEDYTVSKFISDPAVRKEVRTLLMSIVKSPFITDDYGDKAEAFVTKSFSTTNHLGQRVQPEGLAVAYLYDSPTISLTSSKKWAHIQLELVIGPGSTDQSETVQILNLSSPASLENPVFTDWINSTAVPIQLDSLDAFSSFFSPGLFVFEPRANKDILEWYNENKRTQARIIELINEIVAFPLAGGKGMTEMLTDGRVSKRINKKHRIVYTYAKDKITIHQCWGHYDDK